MTIADDWVEIDVDVQVELDDVRRTRVIAIMEAVCQEIARKENLAPAYVSISVVEETVIQTLNRTYRAKDAVTDVLSFALLEGDDEALAVETDSAPTDQLPQCLGDIVICWERVRMQAAEYGHSEDRELAFLTAHGMLHLLGYDHEDQEQEHAMFALQEEVLQALAFTR